MYDKLIEKLRDDSMLENCEFDFVHKYMHEAADAIEDLENRLNLWRQDKIRRWIPVTERLPEINQKVLVFSFYTMHVYKFCALDEKCGAAEDHWQDDYGIAHGIEEVQFWMPLPEPPEDGES